MKASERVTFIRRQLATRPEWALRGLVRIYEAQTADEKRSGLTTHENGVGFTGADAELLSSFARQYLGGGRLSGRQMDLLLAKMPKYARQLSAIADAEKLSAAMVARLAG